MKDLLHLLERHNLSIADCAQYVGVPTPIIETKLIKELEVSSKEWHKNFKDFFKLLKGFDRICEHKNCVWLCSHQTQLLQLKNKRIVPMKPRTPGLCEFIYTPYRVEERWNEIIVFFRGIGTHENIKFSHRFYLGNLKQAQHAFGTQQHILNANRNFIVLKSLGIIDQENVSPCKTFFQEAIRRQYTFSVLFKEHHNKLFLFKITHIHTLDYLTNPTEKGLSDANK